MPTGRTHTPCASSSQEGIRVFGGGGGGVREVRFEADDTQRLYLGTVALRQLLYERVSIGSSSSRLHLLLAGVRVAVADVVMHRAGEEHGLLADQPHSVTQAPQVHVLHVTPVHQHLLTMASFSVPSRGLALIDRKSHTVW